MPLSREGGSAQWVDLGEEIGRRPLPAAWHGHPGRDSCIGRIPMPSFCGRGYALSMDSRRKSGGARYRFHRRQFEPLMDGVKNQFEAVRDAHLVVDRSQVILHRLLGNR